MLSTLEDTFDAFHPLESEPFISFHISSPTLGTLPREIRDFVYTNLTEAGKARYPPNLKSRVPGSVRASLLYKRGTCRIVLSDSRINDFVLIMPQATAMRDLDIRLANVGGFGRHLRLFKVFGDPSVCRT